MKSSNAERNLQLTLLLREKQIIERCNGWLGEFEMRPTGYFRSRNRAIERCALRLRRLTRSHKDGLLPRSVRKPLQPDLIATF